MLSHASCLQATLPKSCFDCVAAGGLLVTVALSASRPLRAELDDQKGRETYERQCASCHGAQGQGVDDAGTGPFAGDHSLADLTRIIDETMPEDDPDACKGPEAQAVAKYVYETFYAQQAKTRQAQARIDLSRLTVRQYENAVADLMATFLGEANAR